MAASAQLNMSETKHLPIPRRQVLCREHAGQAVVSMTITTKEQIMRERARLRMEQLDGDPDQLSHKTEMAHDRINALLDLLDAETLERFNVTHS